MLVFPACLVGLFWAVVMMSLMLNIVGGYLVIGLIVGLAFVLRGVNRIDPVAGDSPWVFRAVILPGSVGLWPVVLWKWAKAGKGAGA